MPARLVVRARIVLRAAEGKQNVEIADELGVIRDTVQKWRDRYVDRRELLIAEKGGYQGRPGGSPQAGRVGLYAPLLHSPCQSIPPHWGTRPGVPKEEEREAWGT